MQDGELVKQKMKNRASIEFVHALLLTKRVRFKKVSMAAKVGPIKTEYLELYFRANEK